MNSHDRDILTQLDTQLPIADVEVARLDERLRSLVDDGEHLAHLNRSYQDGLRRFAEHCAQPGHGPVTGTDVEFLFQSVHAGLPPNTDPVVISALDAKLTRVIEVGINISTGGPPMT